MPKPIRIKTAYGWHKKGDIITPTGMDRSFLLAYGYAEEIKEIPTTAPVIEDAPAVEQEDTAHDFEPEPDPVQEAVQAVAQNTARFNNRRGRNAR